jgi:hypothetical protein
MGLAIADWDADSSCPRTRSRRVLRWAAEELPREARGRGASEEAEGDDVDG